MFYAATVKFRIFKPISSITGSIYQQIQWPLYFKPKCSDPIDSFSLPIRSCIDFESWYHPIGNCEYVGYYSDFFQRTWKSMEYCYYKVRFVQFKGYTKFIGLCHFSINKIENILSICTIKPATIIIECNPCILNIYLDFTQKRLVEYCNRRNISSKLILYLVISCLPFGQSEAFYVTKM